MQTLDLDLQRLSPELDEDLISPECLAEVCEAVRGLPSALTSQFGFECPLQSTSPVADFALRVSSLNERRVFAGASAQHPLPARLLEMPVWGQLRRLGAAWTEPGDPIANELSHIWLEFDVSATRVTDFSVPGAYILIQRRPGNRGDDANHYYPDVERSLRLLSGRDIAPNTMKTVRRCLELAPQEAHHSFFLGIMFGRQSSTVRVCVRGIALDRIPEYLDAARWQGPREIINDTVLPIARHAERWTLDIDAGEEIGTKIGVECGFTSGNSAPAVAALGTALVDADLCIPKAKDKLVSWVGRVFGLGHDKEPPAHLSGMLYLSGLRASEVLLAKVNHVKISFDSDRQLQAKAYLSLERRWSVQPFTENRLWR